MIVPRRVLGRGFQAPSDTVNVAVVGINGMGGRQRSRRHEPEHRRHLRLRLQPPRWQAGGVDERRASLARRRQRRPARKRSTSRPRPRRSSRRTRDGRQTDEYDRLQKFVKDQIPRLQHYQRLPGDARQAERSSTPSIVATPDHMHAIIASAAMDARQTRLRAEAALLVGARSPAPGEESRGTPKLVTQMGNQRHSLDDQRHGVEYIMGGAIGDVARGPRLDESPVRLLAAGNPAAGSRLRNTARLGWDNRGVDQRARRRDGGQLLRSRRDWPGICSSASRPRSPTIRFTTRSTGAAGSTGVVGALGDMGAHLIDFPDVGARSRLPDGRSKPSRPRSTASRTRMPRRRYYQFAGTRQQAAGEAHLVRRRPDAGGAGRTEGDKLNPARRGSLRRQERQAPAGERLRRRACSRLRVTTRWSAAGTAVPRPARRARDELDTTLSKARTDLLSLRLRRAS